MNNDEQAMQDEFTVDKLFRVLIRLYMVQVKRENFQNDGSAEGIYLMAVKKIKTMIAEEPNRIEYYSKMLEVTDKFYALMMDPEVRAQTIKNNMTMIDFYREYREEILGDNKRKYDMSGLFREDYIKGATKVGEGESNKKLLYMPKTCAQHVFYDNAGNRIVIQEIGRVYMEEWNGIRNDITKYRIEKEIGRNKYIVEEIYSNIVFSKMENEEYRNAVFKELLGERNISLSNAEGYVGEITETPHNMIENGLDELEENGVYYYRINDRCALRYDGTDLSAVVMHEKYEQILERQRKDKIAKPKNEELLDRMCRLAKEPEETGESR